jgi:ferric-dicitrate binding protein FerR (iron transport regulator)
VLERGTFSLVLPVGRLFATECRRRARYSAPQIVVARALRQTRFTGTVSPKHVRDWLKALEQIYAVEMVDEGANGVLIRSRADNVTPK